MIIKEAIILDEHRPLAAYIEAVNRYTFSDRSVHSLVPEGRIEFIVQLKGDFHHRVFDQGPWKKRPPTFIGGLHSRAYEVRSSICGGACLGFILRSETAHHLLPIPLDRLTDQVIDIRSVLEGCDGLEQELRAARDDAERIRIFGEIILAHASRSDDNKSEMIEKVLRAEGSPISDLAQKTALSESQFRRVFKQCIGLSPKRYFSIRRVNQALQLLQDAPEKSLTALGYELGYYDQAHFIREFRSITGLTPSAHRRSP